MKFCILASGSSGNSIYIESYYTRVLVDVGLSAREIEKRLLSININPNSIDAIVLTHAHRDHIRGAGVFARQHRLPIVGHPETIDGITYLLKADQQVQPWHEAFRIRNLSFIPFRLSHDCDPTVGYLIEENSRVLAICTDLGVVTREVREHLQRAHAILLESNHDPEMLINGPYPWHLKERIASRVGHLSNHEAGQLLKEILHRGVQRIILGHLSEENNTPSLAHQTVLEYLSPQARQMVEVIPQRRTSAMFAL